MNTPEFRFQQVWLDSKGNEWKVAQVKNKRAYLFCEKTGKDIQRPSGNTEGFTLVRNGWVDAIDGKGSK